MNKTQALHTLFNNFMVAYPAHAVPEDTIFPWLTYEVITANWGDNSVPITVNMWFRTESEAIPNKMAEDFRKYIIENDTVECDEGFIWVKPGEPWCQSLSDDTDPFIKRRYITLTLDYMTR